MSIEGAARAHTTTREEVVAFTRAHLAHLVILPVMAILVTTVHEAAHALAACAQGAEVTDFVVLPSNGLWGSMHYEPPRDSAFSLRAVAIAPYALWLGLACATGLTAVLAKRIPFWLASSLYVWGFVVPLGDIANAAFPYLLGARNDLLDACGPPTLASWVATCAGATSAVLVGYALSKRLYRDRAISPRAYAALCGIFLATFALILVGF